MLKRHVALRSVTTTQLDQDLPHNTDVDHGRSHRHSASRCISGRIAATTQYRDLPHDAQLAITVWGVAEARPLAALGGATMRLFSKKGRLKDGPQELRLAVGRAADLGWPSATPGKLPLARRPELGCALLLPSCARQFTLQSKSEPPSCLSVSHALPLPNQQPALLACSGRAA